MKQADIHWENGEPISRQFDDVYFSRSDGLAESEYVFLKQNRLPEAWRNQDQFVIAETGFGTGLNFLLTVKQWLQTQPDNSHLFYYSAENFPLCQHDLKQALSNFPEISDVSQELSEAYPMATPGFHVMSLFNHRVTLCLMLGDACEQLAQMHTRVDAWYLDGFTPSKNPHMWSDALFQQMARLSHAGTRFSTFTAAGFVRRGLVQAGFDVQKVKGFGQKQEMLCGQWSEQAKVSTQQPWFELPDRQYPIKRVAVLGAGIAGVTTAWALAKRGWQVDLIDQRDQLAEEASGNPLGVVMPRISLDDSAEAEFYASAYGYAINALTRLKQADDSLQWYTGGVLQLPSSARIKKQMQVLDMPQEYAQRINAAQASELAGIKLDHEALYFPKAGCLNPKNLCQHLLKQYPDRIRWHKATRVVGLSNSNGRWQTLGDTKNIISDTEALVLCHAYSIKQLPITEWMSLEPVRGQISYLPANDVSRDLKIALCYEGYLLPQVKQQHVIGASFKPGDGGCELRDDEHRENLASLQQWLPDLLETSEATQGRAAVRVVSPDRMPIVGPVADRAFVAHEYADLQKGKPATQYPKAQFLSGLYVNTAHGARGLTSGWLSAEIIAAQLNLEPLPVSSRVAVALHPSRFMIRALKKGQSI